MADQSSVWVISYHPRGHDSADNWSPQGVYRSQEQARRIAGDLQDVHPSMYYSIDEYAPVEQAEPNVPEYRHVTVGISIDPRPGAGRWGVFLKYSEPESILCVGGLEDVEEASEWASTIDRAIDEALRYNRITASDDAR